MSQPKWAKALPWVLVIFSWVAASFLEILEIDSAQYATMARDLVQSGDWLHLMDRGRDYLDKPPLIFWSSGLSFLLFGVSTFTFKLPSLLFCFLAVWSIQRMGTLVHSASMGWTSALIFSSSVGVFIMNQDVKTDMYLVGAVAFSTWKLLDFDRTRRYSSLFLAGLGLGLGMLAKGPMGILAPGVAVGGDWLLRRQWKSLFRWQWILLPVLVFVVISPFLWGLYTQYDLHPEKNIHGETGVSGVKFFLWTQSFGRITGESEWANDAGPFFLVHNFLWLFLPWTLFLLTGLGTKVMYLVRTRFSGVGNEEFVSFFGFVLVFLALSFSRYKLPHYVFVTFPFAALLVGGWLERWIALGEARGRFWGGFMAGLSLFLVAGGISFGLWTFPTPIAWISLLIFLPFAAYFFILKKTSRKRANGIEIPAMAMGSLLSWLALAWFPILLDFQSPAKAGQWIQQKQIPVERVFALNESGRSLDFYAGKVVPYFHPDTSFGESHPGDSLVIYTDSKGINFLMGRDFDLEILRVFPHFSPNRLRLPFLVPQTRAQSTKIRYLVQIKKRG